MTTAAVIVAAGRGSRAGGGLPKQWRPLRGRAVAAWTIDAFRTSPHVSRIVIVLHPDDLVLGLGYEGHPGVTIVEGGATRAASVRAGLEALEGEGMAKVLIHDVARPLVSQALIARVAEALEVAEAAAPAVPVVDALWRGEAGQVADTVDRTDLWRAQTPQGFRFEAILAAHRAHGGDAADDVAVARAAGLAVAIVPGDETNIKITTAEDFARAAALMEEAVDVRVGNGFDVHAFGPGDHVVLCGIQVPHERGLRGHSDADVGLHALTDALYGALAEGDIGRHFPPTDPGWRDADSAIFLEHAVSRALARGFEITGLDCTLICEQPKIAPHAAAMIVRVADIVGIDPTRVSIKATTTEGLGFPGRGEGIAAMATATLVKQ